MKFLLSLGIFFILSASAWASGAGGEGTGMTHRMMMLALQMGVILFAAKLGSIAFERMKLPGVLGELCAGMLIGPYLLGHIAFPGFDHGLFPIASATFPISPELYGVCSIAAIILLFIVGLETDIELFLKYSLVGSLVGIGGVAFSFVLGNITTIYLSQVIFGETLTFLSPPCLLLGVISTATSVGITARVLSEKRQMDTPEGVTILAGAVIDDVLGIIMLAICIGVLTATSSSGSVDWGHIGMIAGKAVGMWLGATVVGILLSHKLSRFLKFFKTESGITISALGLALLLAGIFEEAGLAMIIGAYVMGLSLSKTDLNHLIIERLEPISAFLIPIFFCVMGMLVDISVLASPKILLFGAIYTVVAIVAKVVGCGIPAMMRDFNMRGALRIGVGMLPRGEVALIISGIGVATGYLSKEYFGVGIIMTLITTLIAPPILIRLFADSTSGLRTPSTIKKREPLVFTFPSTQTAGLLSSKILEVFKAEGFFIHAIDHGESLYQLRKDLMIITHQHKDTTIHFDCDAEQRAYVVTVIYEVLADLETMIKELRKPIDRKEITQKLHESQKKVTLTGTLAEYIHLNALAPRLDPGSKEEVIDQLLRILYSTGEVNDVDLAREAVLKRESSMSTGMQNGIAIPHGRTSAVNNLVCAIGICPEGVEFSAMDKKPSTIFVLTLSPEGAVSPYMHFMSMISQLLNDQGREKLLTCKTSHEMYCLITGHAPSNGRMPHR